jgi:hypothetical protein
MGVLALYGSRPLSHSAILKGGHVGAWESTFTVSTVPQQTLAIRSDCEGDEARGTAHSVATTVAPFNIDDTDSYHDRRRHYVIVLVSSRYIYVIPRL